MSILKDIDLIVSILQEIEQALNELPKFDNEAVDSSVEFLKTKLSQALAIVHSIGL